jgi:hypothetical protein
MKQSRRALGCVASLVLALGAMAALAAAPAGAADPVGYVVAQGEAECWLASVDLVTGETTTIGDASPDQCAFDLEFTPDGTRLLGTHIDADGEGGGTAHLVEFDLTTGAVTTLSVLGDFPIGGPGPAQGNLTFTPSGSLYTYLVPIGEEPASLAVDPACDGSAFCLFQVNTANPTELTYVNSVPQFLTVYRGLATSCGGVTTSLYDNDTDIAAAGWASATATGPQTLAQVNLTSTGPGSTDIGQPGEVFLTSLDYDTAGTLYAVGFNGGSQASVFTLDPTTGTATDLVSLNDGSTPLAIGVTGFAIAHPCGPTPPPEAPAAQPIAAVAPRFTG